MAIEISKANGYLLNRLESLREEKIIIDTKMKKIEYEINVVSEKISEMSENIDITFEIFSPRMKENSFSREEIDLLKTRRAELEKLYNGYSEQVTMIDEDMELIVDALKEFRPDLNLNEENFITLEGTKEVTEEETLYGIKILEKQEMERNRIARDLYDSSVQILNNLIHKCDICSKVVDKDPLRAKLELETMSKSLHETIEEMNSIIYNLRPMSMDNTNLEESIAKFIEEIKKETAINITFGIKGEQIELPLTMKLTFIRIIKEAVLNAIKHSYCNNVHISIIYEVDKIIIYVEDDGIGFDVDSIYNSEKVCLGLSMLKERVYLLAGTVDIESTEGKGTRIEVIVPIE